MNAMTLNSFFEQSHIQHAIMKGCVVDTNVLFAAIHDPEHWNTWADRFFEGTRNLKTPVYSNINIRSEFLDLYRRAIIPEALLSAYPQLKIELPLRSELFDKAFKKLDTRMRDAKERDQSLIFQDREIKEWEKLFNLEDGSKDVILWSSFCESYVWPQMNGIWDRTTAELGLNFAGSRATDEKELFNSRPEWSEVEDIMGRTGIASYDAMILNFFQCSKFQVIGTADQQVAAFAEKIKPNAWVLIPNEAENQ